MRHCWTPVKPLEQEFSISHWPLGHPVTKQKKESSQMDWDWDRGRTKRHPSPSMFLLLPLWSEGWEIEVGTSLKREKFLEIIRSSVRRVGANFPIPPRHPHQNASRIWLDYWRRGKPKPLCRRHFLFCCFTSSAVAPTQTAYVKSEIAREVTFT